MAAISGTLTTSAASSIFTPTDVKADVVISNRGNGEVILEATATGTEAELVSKQSGSYTVETPDTSGGITYTFRGTGSVIDYDYYMGP